MDVKIKFYEQSCSVQKPIVTPNVLWLKRVVTDDDKVHIRKWLSLVITRSIELGRKEAQAEMRKALGIE